MQKWELQPIQMPPMEPSHPDTSSWPHSCLQPPTRLSRTLLAQPSELPLTLYSKRPCSHFLQETALAEGRITSRSPRPPGRSPSCPKSPHGTATGPLFMLLFCNQQPSMHSFQTVLSEPWAGPDVRCLLGLVFETRMGAGDTLPDKRCQLQKPLLSG